ncbi:MAG: hypothetical protein LKM30_05705 [Bacilli bacterium]|jgi:signal transduction histidine kinase|nr:hypothetical protein [Bacilli bacterium]
MSQKEPFKARFQSFFHPQGIHLEMMRYQVNRPSYSLELVSVLFFVLAFSVLYSGTSISGAGNGFLMLGWSSVGGWSFVDVLLNILLLLLMFFSAIEMEAYSVGFGIASLAVGVFQIVRILALPLAMKAYGLMGNNIFICVVIFYVLSGLSSLLAGLISLMRGLALKKSLGLLKKSAETEKAGK